MRNMKVIKILFSLIIGSFMCWQVNSQTVEYDFIKEELNVIHNAKELNGFFQTLEEPNRNKINIVHIGDFYLQASQLTKVLRDNFQHLFGNGGRGIVVPYEVAEINSREDMFSFSKYKWESKRISKPMLPQPTGIAGITIWSEDPNASFSIQLPPKYAFTQMTLFFENDENSFDLVIKDSVNSKIADVKRYISEDNRNIAVIPFDKPTSWVEILNLRTDPAQNHTTIYGINTENRNTGLIYHSIGVQGSEFTHYTDSEYFNKQVPVLNPDLIIVSLGINEAYRKDEEFNEQSVNDEIKSFLNNLDQYNPNVPLLITIPANAYLDKTIENPKLKAVSDVLVKLCEENDIAYWNMQEVGGKAINWKNNDLYADDMIHFNEKGYQLEGDLLFKAIIKAYENYSSIR